MELNQNIINIRSSAAENGESTLSGIISETGSTLCCSHKYYSFCNVI